ncbi:hypothetical protein D3C87_1169970 [compost metagenome]
MIGAIDAGRIVDGIGIDPAPVARELDAPKLGEAEVAAFSHHLAAQFGAIHAHRVVGAVAGLLVGLGRRLDVGADAAVVEQVDGRHQQRVDQVRRRQRAGRDAQRRLHLRREGDGLGGARIDAAARRDQRGVIVGPA